MGRVKEYVRGQGEMSLAARARDAASKVESGSLKRDLEAFARAIELAYERKDVKLLILAHRIVHDLDYWVFNHETFYSSSNEFLRGSRDYWRATVTLEGKEVNSSLESSRW
ncbi:MAG TPA: hypothetical protein GXX40_02820 [Firmicutes bacterium]|nr:hypothetical protein [Bacillota bacterium]